jgi:hypothetical protein
LHFSLSLIFESLQEQIELVIQESRLKKNTRGFAPFDLVFAIKLLEVISQTLFCLVVEMIQQIFLTTLSCKLRH